MFYLFNGLHFSSATNTRFLQNVLESLDSPRQTGCVWREGQGFLAHDGFCTRPAQYKRGIVCLARDGWLEQGY